MRPESSPHLSLPASPLRFRLHRIGDSRDRTLARKALRDALTSEMRERRDKTAQSRSQRQLSGAIKGRVGATGSQGATCGIRPIGHTHEPRHAEC
jgi:hypothetical protein